MKKQKLSDVPMGAVFSRVIIGYRYTKTGDTHTDASGMVYPVCKCYDSGKVYCWEPNTMVYVHYTFKKKEEVTTMFKEGQNSSGSCAFESDIPIKEEPMTGVEPVYKVVRIEDGEYLSVFVGSKRHRFPQPDMRALTYKIGEVTQSASGDGIYLFKDWEVARKAYGADVYDYDPNIPLAILECLPIGENMFYNRNECRYPAVYVVKEVWREEVKRPEPKFKVGDKVILNTDEDTGTRLPCGTRMTVKNCSWYRYKGGHYDYSVEENVFVYNEEWLCPAPKEEWVDVTEECKYIPRKEGDTANGSNYVLLVRHNGRVIAHIFSDGPRPFGGEDYRCVCGKDGGWFSIYKKVIQ